MFSIFSGPVCIPSGTMIQSLVWNDETNMLVALNNGRFTVWYYPNAIYVDNDVLSKTVMTRDARYVLDLGDFIYA